jgi:hypothetical protein
MVRRLTGRPSCLRRGSHGSSPDGGDGVRHLSEIGLIRYPAPADPPLGPARERIFHACLLTHPRYFDMLQSGTAGRDHPGWQEPLRSQNSQSLFTQGVRR